MSAKNDSFHKSNGVSFSFSGFGRFMNLAQYASRSTDATPAYMEPVQNSAEERLVVSGRRATALFPVDFLCAPLPSMVHNMKAPFPWKLYQLLEDMEVAGGTSIVSWMNQGKAFRVHDASAFIEHIMSRYFRMSKFQSFTRQCKHLSRSETCPEPVQQLMTPLSFRLSQTLMSHSQYTYTAFQRWKEAPVMGHSTTKIL
jgi:hypothetical protein